MGSRSTLDGVHLTGDEVRHLARVYGVRLDEGNDLQRAAAELNTLRQARVDGLRMAAVLGRFLEPGQDPVRLLVELLGEAGYDVGMMFDESAG